MVERKRRSKRPLLPSGAHLPGQRCDRSATGQHRSRPGSGTGEGPLGSAGDLGPLTGEGAEQGGGDAAGAFLARGPRGGAADRAQGPESTLQSSRESLRNSLGCSFVVTAPACFAASAPRMGSDRQAAAVDVPWPGSPGARAFSEPHPKPPGGNPVMSADDSLTGTLHGLRMHSPLMTVNQ